MYSYIVESGKYLIVARYFAAAKLLFACQEETLQAIKMGKAGLTVPNQGEASLIAQCASFG